MDKIYGSKWYTPEAINALKQIEPLLLRAACPSQVPLSWGVEVLELLTLLDTEFGIARPTSHVFGYRIHGTMFDWLLLRPLRTLVAEAKSVFMAPAIQNVSVVRNAYLKLNSAVMLSLDQFIYGFRCIKYRHINNLLNVVFRPKLELIQVKEKYGTLRVYYSGPSYLNDHIDFLIKKTEAKLSVKGAYTDLQTLWSLTKHYSVDNEFNPDLIVSKKTNDGVAVVETCYRKAIKELDIDTTDLVKNEKKYNDL